jgi:hypothetical protein
MKTTSFMEQGVSEKLIITQPVNKFPNFYGNRRYIIVFTTACHRTPSCGRWVQSYKHTKLKSHFNIILYYTSGFSKRSFAFSFSESNSACISRLSYACWYISHLFFSLDFVILISGEQFKLWSSPAPHSTVYSSIMSLPTPQVETLTSAPCCQPPAVFLS